MSYPFPETFSEETRELLTDLLPVLDKRLRQWREEDRDVNKCLVAVARTANQLLVEMTTIGSVKEDRPVVFNEVCKILDLMHLVPQKNLLIDSESVQ